MKAEGHMLRKMLVFSITSTVVLAELPALAQQQSGQQAIEEIEIVLRQPNRQSTRIGAAVRTPERACRFVDTHIRVARSDGWTVR